MRVVSAACESRERELIDLTFASLSHIVGHLLEGMRAPGAGMLLLTNGMVGESLSWTESACAAGEAGSPMTTHDPYEFAVSLSAKLAARSRHLCMFLGAGAARACRLPDVAGLQASVQLALGGDDRAAFDRQLAGRNIEQVLSRLRRISCLIAGGDTIDGLTGEKAKKLDGDICQQIVKALDITGKDLAPVFSLAAWLARADYQKPVELFTTNYDLLLEAALEELAIPYFDGFVGNVRARFQTELVEASRGIADGHLPAQFIRLWKLHGSVNWLRADDGRIVRLGQPAGLSHLNRE